jgi:hypothetical protein
MCKHALRKTMRYKQMAEIGIKVFNFCKWGAEIALTDFIM